MTSAAGLPEGRDSLSTGREIPLSRIDYVALTGLALFSAWYLRGHVSWNGLPSEDALMLLRYSKHLAEGYGIRWNVGEAPVEGATDFLYMVLVGLVSKVTHVGIITSGRILLMLTHVLSVLVLYTGARRLFAWPVWASLCLSLYLAVDISRAYISMGFSPPFYAFFALVAWYLTLRCIIHGATAARGVGLGIFLTLVYLIRPEGIFLDGFILLSLLYALGRPALRAVVCAGIVLCMFGVPYFLWRWHYFGYVFPNPLYLKGGGHLHVGSLIDSFRNSWVMLAPLVPIYVLELLSSHWKRAVTALIPTAGFTCIWILLSNENNHSMRFQYCGIPIAILALPYAATALRERFAGFSLRPIYQVAVVAIALFFSMQYWDVFSKIPPPDFGLYNIAIGMNAYKDKGYVVATTEAGIIPYFSDWPAVDVYGLNDAEIVHNPHGLTESYLEQWNPAVILDHVPGQDFLADNLNLKRAVEVTYKFATTHNYELVAVWGYNACDRHLWYVRRDLPEAAALSALMRRFPYVISGITMLDLRDVPVPVDCSDPLVHLGLSQ